MNNIQKTNNLFHKRNINKAINEFKLSSEKCNSYASCILGLMYEVGEETERNINKSFKFYKKSSDQGNSKGFFRIGRCFASSEFVKKKKKKKN